MLAGRAEPEGVRPDRPPKEERPNGQLEEAQIWLKATQAQKNPNCRAIGDANTSAAKRRLPEAHPSQLGPQQGLGQDQDAQDDTPTCGTEQPKKI